MGQVRPGDEHASVQDNKRDVTAADPQVCQGNDAERVCTPERRRFRITYMKVRANGSDATDTMTFIATDELIS